MSWIDRGIKTDPIRYVDGCFTAQGKVFNATASKTIIAIPDLAGYGDDFFNARYYMQVIKNANSIGNAPDGEYRKITDYVSATGTFTTEAFSANVETGDEVIIIHETAYKTYSDTDLASKVFVKNITNAANAGSVTIATVDGQAVIIDSINVSAKTASQGDLTSAAIYGGVSKAITFLNETDMAKANIDAVDECVSWVGAHRLAVGKSIAMELKGTGATPVDLMVSIAYHAEVAGGKLI